MATTNTFGTVSYHDPSLPVAPTPAPVIDPNAPSFTVPTPDNTLPASRLGSLNHSTTVGGGSEINITDPLASYDLNRLNRESPTNLNIGENYNTDAARTANTQAYNPNMPSQWDVANNQTVQGQVKGIIDANSPLMQQAETRSLQQMNGRGLINSSMAIGAGQSALYDAAMPMANADAAMYGRAAEHNNTANNQFRMADKNQGFDLAKMDKANEYDLGKMDKNQGFDLAKMDKANEYDLGKMDKNQGFDLAKMDKTFAQQTAQLEQKFGYDKELTKLQSDSQRETANIQARYRNLTQASSSAASLMNNASDHIHQIMMNENLDAVGKQAAISAYTANLNKSLQLIGSFAGDVDLSDLLASLLE